MEQVHSINYLNQDRFRPSRCRQPDRREYVFRSDRATLTAHPDY